jgi:4-amino-4-deoxy-L-arabinose transferase-like glycosyltransferase
LRKNILWLALVAFILTWAISSLWWPFGHDQGIFAWVGEVILNGGTPYRDAWEVKGPLGHYVYALAQLLFGRTMWGIRLLDLCFLALGLTALWWVTARLYNDTAARLAVALFTLWYASGGYWMTAQPDGWAAMLLAVVVACLIDKKGSTHLKPAVIGGAAIGLCCLVKLIYAAYLLLFVVYAIFYWPTHTSRRNLLWSIVVSTFSCSVVIGLAMAWFAYKGALADLLQIQFVFNGSVHRLAHTYSLPGQILGVIGFVQQGWVAIALLPATLGIAILWHRQRPLAAVIVTWAVLALLGVLVQNKFYPYHWLPLYGSLALATGGGLSHLLRGSRAASNLREHKDLTLAPYPWFAKLSTTVLALVFILAMVAPTHSLLRWTLRVNGYESWNSYYEGFGTYDQGDFSFKADQEVARYVAAHTTAEDSVLVWGFEVLVNYLSGRRSPTRFGYNYPLSRGHENTVEQAYRTEFMQALRVDPPRYILVLDQDKNNLMPKTSRQFLNDFPEFKSFLNKHYQLETTIEHFAIWRHQPFVTEKAGR